MSKGLIRWLVGILVVLYINATAYASQRDTSKGSISAMVALPGHVLPALAKATIVPSEANAGSERITLTIVLKRDDEAGFKRYLGEIYHPHSQDFHHFLTQREIADRFGPSLAEYQAVRRYLQRDGFKHI
jgi:subtilase family serine protease